MMMYKMAFVLYFGKLFSWIYHSRQKDCKKTANANFIEMIIYGLITIITYIIGT